MVRLTVNSHVSVSFHVKTECENNFRTSMMSHLCVFCVSVDGETDSKTSKMVSHECFFMSQ